ncbi:MAG: M13 family metallopeptidase N-terminal domain-containing protein, partial [Pseudolysinimonas sp.]
MTHGIDTTQFDPQIRVQDDLFRHVNGPWLRTADIKPDRATAGAFVVLVDEAEAKVRAIIESVGDNPADDEQRKIGDLYASFMDEERIEALGAQPLTGELAQVDSITDIETFVRTLGALDRQGVGSVFGMYIGPDSGNPERYVTHLDQGGLGLPDESYYRDDEFADIRAAYIAHLTTMLGLAGLAAAADRAERIMGLETKIAGHHWDRVACRDAQKTYNLVDRDALKALAPAFDWAAWSDAASIPAPVLAEVVVGQPSYLEGLETLLVADELESWQDWLRWQVVRSASPYLSSDFVNANFAFYGKTLSGTDELRPRWKRGVGFVEGAMGEAVGKIYVRTEFPPASEERMTELIDNLIEAYRKSISALPWMSDETKQRAQDKLNTFDPKIGHPKKFRDYSALETAPDDL